MKQPQQCPTAEVERMMKLQDVLLKAIAKKITWWNAAEIVGVSDRTMRRWLERREHKKVDGTRSRLGLGLPAAGRKMNSYARPAVGFCVPV